MEGFDLDQIRVAIYNYLAGGMMRWKASGTGKRIPLPIAESEEYLKALPALWPTPTSCDHKGLVPLATYRILCGEKRANGSRIGMTLCLHPLIILDKVRNGGQLNPVWLEWLMGYPAGWTSMK